MPTIPITPHARDQIRSITYDLTAAVRQKVTYSDAIVICAEILRTHPELALPAYTALQERYVPGMTLAPLPTTPDTPRHHTVEAPTP